MTTGWQAAAALAEACRTLDVASAWTLLKGATDRESACRIVRIAARGDDTPRSVNFWHLMHIAVGCIRGETTAQERLELSIWSGDQDLGEEAIHEKADINYITPNWLLYGRESMLAVALHIERESTVRWILSMKPKIKKTKSLDKLLAFLEKSEDDGRRNMARLVRAAIEAQEIEKGLSKRRATTSSRNRL